MSNFHIYSELMLTNLNLLFLKHPVSDGLRELLHKDLFIVPNQKASNELIRYLYVVIDNKKYGCKLPWPLLYKRMESEFYTLVHKISREIIDENPEVNLQKVPKSFFVMPSGEKYVHFMSVLTSIPMRNELKKAGYCLFPYTRNEEQLKMLNENLADYLTQQTLYIKQSQSENKKRERAIRLQLDGKRLAVSQLKVAFRTKIENSLPQHVKNRLTCLNDRELLDEWSTLLKQRSEKLEKGAQVVKEIKWNVTQFHKALAVKAEASVSTSEPQNLASDVFLSDVLLDAESALRVLQCEGPVDLSAHMPELQASANKLNVLSGSVTDFSAELNELRDKTSAKLPQLEEALYSSEEDAELAAQVAKQDRVSGHSLANLLCGSTPPEKFRRLKIIDFRRTELSYREGETPKASRLHTVEERDERTVTTEEFTPESLDMSTLKPVCFERKFYGSTWKHAQLLSTLKKKRRQAQECGGNIENEETSQTTFSVTSLTRQGEGTLNSVRSPSTVGCGDSAENSEKVLGEKIDSSDFGVTANGSVSCTTAYGLPKQSGPGESTADIHTLAETQDDTAQLLHEGAAATASASTLLQPYCGEQDGTDAPIADQRQLQTSDASPHVSSVNISQELQDFLKAMTNSKGSIMGVSSVFDSSSLSSPLDNINMTGVNQLELSTPRLSKGSSHTDVSPASWNDLKDLSRIVSLALSPSGILPAELRSSTPISSNQKRHSDLAKCQKQDEKPTQTEDVESRIPRFKSLAALRVRKF